MTYFCRTATGTEIHIAWPVREATLCGRKPFVEVDAIEVLWFRVCSHCRRTAEAFGKARYADLDPS